MAKNWRETISFYSGMYDRPTLIWTYRHNEQAGNNGIRVNGVYVYPTAYRRVRSSHRSGYYVYRRISKNEYHADRCDTYNPGSVEYKDYNTLLREAKIRMVNNIDGAMLAHDFVEAMSQTTSFFKRIPGTIRLLKRKKYRQAFNYINGVKTARKAIPDTYLAFVFGVKPMIQEICETWEHLKDPKAYTFKLTSSASDKVELNTSKAIRYESKDQPGVTGWQKTTVVSKVKCYRYFRDNAYDSLNGVSLNPVPMIWDTIPYSFMVDWFIPIQPIINGLSYSGVKAVNGCNSYYYRREDQLEITAYDRKGDYEVFGHNPEPNVSLTFSRRLDSTVGLSLAEAKAHINAQMNLSKSKLLSAFAIAWQHCIK